MGNQCNEKSDCNLKHRIIPKLTPTDAKKDDSTDAATEEPRKETVEERVARISQVKLTFSDFVFKCLDHDMLKLFALCMIGFFLIVGFITCIYLVIIYFFKASLWYYYFPTEAQIRAINKEL